MSERSLTIWKLLITFAILSIVAGGFSLYPKNKKYRKIIAKSSRTFGTDKDLENVIEYLEIQHAHLSLLKLKHVFQLLEFSQEALAKQIQAV